MDKRRRLMLSAEETFVRPEGDMIYFAGDEGFSCDLQKPDGYFVRPQMEFKSKYLKLSYISNDTEYSPAIQFLVPALTLETYKYLTIIYKMETWQSKVTPLLQVGSYTAASARIYLSKSFNKWETGTLSNPFYHDSIGFGRVPITLHFSSITSEDVNAVVTLPDGTKDFNKKVNRTMLVRAIYLHN